MAATERQGPREVAKAADPAPAPKNDAAQPKSEPVAAPAAPAPTRSIQEAAKELRRARARRLAKRMAIFVLLPTLLATVYYSRVASSQYESYSVFTIHSAQGMPSIGLGLDGLLSGIGSGAGSRDVLAVRDYVLSRDMLARLNKEHGFVAHYQADSLDFMSRLGKNASFEDAYQYFADKVSADFDLQSGSLTLRVRAFSADKSVELSKAVLTYSEEMVNKLSERERRDRMQDAELDVTKAEGRLTKARQALMSLQQKYGDFNPLATATGTMTVRTQLEGELAKARAELMQLKSYMNDDAPRVLAAQSKVNSLSAQVSGESRRLVDTKGADGLNTSLADFDSAMVEKEFAQKAYEASMAALEIARSDANRQHRYLATIATPSKPDESTYPRRFVGVLTVFVVSFLLMGIGTLLSAAVREHARL